ncbi:MAG: hypothetical protein IT332_09890 [Ardenticatenales bacterium]|nr:hypothetical protein [Ardenticatenales bacterium]
MTASPVSPPPSAAGAGRRLFRAFTTPDALALLALTATCAAFFAPVLSARYWLPQGGGDLASFLWPMYRFAAGRIAAGDLPLWNPHQYAGAPLLADNQSGLLYPPLWLLYLLKPAFSYVDLERVVMGHMLFTGVAMYACLRLWRRRSSADVNDPLPDAMTGFAIFPSLVGALAWMLNDVFLTHLGNLNLNAAAGWLPLALLGIHRACDPPTAVRVGAGLRPAPTHGRANVVRTWSMHRSAGWIALAALSLALSALAGHAQATFLCALAVSLHALWRTAADRRRRPLVALAAAGAAAFALAAPALLPTLALRPATVRATYDYATSVQYSLPPRALVGLVAPWWWGRGAAAFHGDWDRVEVGYVGVVPVLLAIVAILAAAAARHDRHRHRDAVFFAVLAIVALLVALGPATPVHRLLIAPLHLPFRAPARYLLLVDFALSWLAAAGAAAVIARVARAAAARSPAGPSARWRRPAAAIGALLVLATAVDLVALGAGVEIDRADPTAGYWRTPAKDWLAANGATFTPGDADLPLRIDEATGAWQPGSAQLWGLYSLGGIYNPSRLGTYSFAMDGLQHRGSPLYNLFGVGWCLTDKGAAPSDAGRWTKAFTGDAAVDIWRNDGALPRIRLVPHAHVARDDLAAFDRLRDPTHDPRTSVVFVAADVEADVAAHADKRPDDPTDPLAAAASPVVVDAYTPDRITLRIHVRRPSFLVLSDVWHPDWRAAVDGVPAPVLRADFLFRAVALDAGAHIVELRYRPRGWRLGLELSAVMWAVLLAGAARVSARRG